MPDVLRIWDALFADPRRFELLHYLCTAMVVSVACARAFPVAQTRRPKQAIIPGGVHAKRLPSPLNEFRVSPGTIALRSYEATSPRTSSCSRYASHRANHVPYVPWPSSLSLSMRLYA